MRVLIDTNVALDLMMDRAPFADAAEKVFTSCCSELVEGYFSANSIVDMHYLLHHYLHDEQYSRDLIDSWLSIVGIAEVLPVDCKNAMDSEMNDYEDAVMANIAERNGFDYIVTRNLKHFGKSSVPAVSPDAFISLMMKYRLD